MQQPFRGLRFALDDPAVCQRVNFPARTWNKSSPLPAFSGVKTPPPCTCLASEEGGDSFVGWYQLQLVEGIVRVGVLLLYAQDLHVGLGCWEWSEGISWTATIALPPSGFSLTATVL